MSGTLYMIPCPIAEGEPYDVLPAANGRVLQSVDYYVVENVRTARRFLSRAGVGRPIDSLTFAELNEHTDPREVEGLLRPVLEGRDCGVISEAGLPGVADPGAAIVAAAHRYGVKVVPLVGPSSILMALMASGQNGQSFAFNGYLPVKPEQRGQALRRFEKRAQTEGQAQIFIEAPYRNIKLMEDMLRTLSPETILTVAMDLTGPEEYVASAPIKVWRGRPMPDINKRPAIFILGRA
ncbi:MAG: SAM-dependent methyltransferase [Rikenellaceae bacterium]|nr:SAM-dependent methyltransferase [Rikenellaceae bacterium]